jgi:hypothetical protein
MRMARKSVRDHRGNASRTPSAFIVLSQDQSSVELNSVARHAQYLANDTKDHTNYNANDELRNECQHQRDDRLILVKVHARTRAQIAQVDLVNAQRKRLLMQESR